MKVSVMSWNLRYDRIPDNVPLADSLRAIPGPLVAPHKFHHGFGEQPWSVRRIRVAQLVRTADVDLAGQHQYLRVCYLS